MFERKTSSLATKDIFRSRLARCDAPARERPKKMVETFSGTFNVPTHLSFLLDLSDTQAVRLGIEPEALWEWSTSLFKDRLPKLDRKGNMVSFGSYDNYLSYIISLEEEVMVTIKNRPWGRRGIPQDAVNSWETAVAAEKAKKATT
jgi:hypothetical protein